MLIGVEADGMLIGVERVGYWLRMPSCAGKKGVGKDANSLRIWGRVGY